MMTTAKGKVGGKRWKEDEGNNGGESVLIRLGMGK